MSGEWNDGRWKEGAGRLFQRKDAEALRVRRRLRNGRNGAAGELITTNNKDKPGLRVQ